MFPRFFLFLLLFYIGFKIYLALRRRPRGAGRKGDDAAGEEMVQDPQCLSYVPKSAAMLRGGHYFCSEQCAALYLVARPS
ncbi:MAG TPA: hypothetical protein VGA73_16020 [Candidatus Binatia bacterium]